jgi:hypothetical protein
MKCTEALAPPLAATIGPLAVALRLKRSGPDTAAMARAVFVTCFDGEGTGHFRTEEDVLLPAYTRHGDPNHPAVVRVPVEHLDLRRRAYDRATSRQTDPPELRELGKRLERHIRHEERVLFPMIEDALPVDEIELLAAALKRADDATSY